MLFRTGKNNELTERLSARLRRNWRRGMMLLIALLPMLLGITCKKEPTEPYTPPVEQPPKRDYVWTMDTLTQYGNSYTYRSMYVVSDSDIYVCGLNSWGEGAIDHYNGQKWAPVLSLNTRYGGPLDDSYNLSTIAGTDKNNIYIVGGRYIYQGTTTAFEGFIGHYDGIKWSRIYLGGPLLNRIYIRSKNEIYFGGDSGRVINYDGVTFNVMQLDSKLEATGIGGNNSYIYLGAASYVNTLWDSVYLYRYDGNGWSWFAAQAVTELNSNAKFGFRKSYHSPDGKFYNVGYGIFSLVEDVITNEYKTSHSLIGINGSSSNNILVVGADQRILHWNGINWGNIYTPTIDGTWSINFYDVWTNGKVIFIIGNDSYRSYFFKGK